MRRGKAHPMKTKHGKTMESAHFSAERAQILKTKTAAGLSRLGFLHELSRRISGSAGRSKASNIPASGRRTVRDGKGNLRRLAETLRLHRQCVSMTQNSNRPGGHSRLVVKGGVQEGTQNLPCPALRTSSFGTIPFLTRNYKRPASRHGSPSQYGKHDGSDRR